ncbi:MAG: FHA domain-containing protein [Deltaproteobacteria bacterium]|nr:FHA domain-containing protein [Deltaproteobacteria bacterium]
MRELEGKVCKISHNNRGAEESILLEDGAIVIGRAYDSDLVLSHESISRHHAQLVREDRGWVIVDLDSKNGIKVNTYRVERKLLESGDRVDVGAVRLYVEILDQRPASEAKVIFKEEAEGLSVKTEVIDMNHLDVLFGNSTELPALDACDSQPHWPHNASDGGAVRDQPGILHLFSNAAEALLTSETLDQTLDRILAQVFASLPAERGVICLYDEESDTTEAKVMRTLEGVTDDPIVISTHITREVIKQKRALLVQDTQADHRFGGAESVIMMKIHSAMCAPLYRDRRVIGFIYVDRHSPETPFQTHHLQALSALAILSAVAVEQSALRDRLGQEREIRARLARYSSPAVVERIVADPEVAGVGMAADEGEVSVLFADLTGFTAMAETMNPTEVVRLLNQVFERLTEAVFDYEGTLDKFRGDGMMAFFGAPLAQPDHAERAVKAALRMQALLADLNANAHNRRFISMRIGINSGPVVVGDIGSPQRKDYTVIGDVVNVASRLEASIAQPGQVVIGSQTRRDVRSKFRCEALPDARLKGKIRSVKPYLVLGRRTSARAAKLSSPDD